MAHLVCTILGPDQPGLVDRVSGIVSSHHGNWERSQMARLSGKFAGIVEIRVPDQHADDLHAALDGLGESVALEISVERAEHVAPSAGARPRGHGGRRLSVALVGIDRPGLLHAVSAAMAAAGANIEQLTTATVEAAMSGDLLFEATAIVTLPDDVEASALRGELEALADRLMVELSLDE